MKYDSGQDEISVSIASSTECSLPVI